MDLRFDLSRRLFAGLRSSASGCPPRGRVHRTHREEGPGSGVEGVGHGYKSTRWRISSHSATSNCVAVARLGPVGVRDSKLADGPIVAMPPAAWCAFLDGVRPR
ncbi:DUF397 domain-containing protein [Embleya sp. NPDC059237]|uniref:DUF397 domain-containing protein n=1 Tax=Embleya sp. NPDC059237 TaxID=3346784 RepID=UPI00368B7180